jgi:Protein of unknown function (DUF3303)
MLFQASWTRRDSGATEDGDRRVLAILEKFSVPDGVTVHSWVERIDGTGGFGLLEADDPQALAAGFPIFGPYFAFEAVPVIQHDQAVAALSAAVAFREGLS